MRSLWKGAISFGLVNIPVKLYTATQNKDIRFRYLHQECSSPVQYRKFCPVCNQNVESEQIVAGYEYQKGRFVVIEDEDLSQLPRHTTHTIDILDFVDLAQVDPVYFDKSYYLEPAAGGEKAYALLIKAMETTAKTAIAKIVIRTRQNLAAIRVHQEVLILETMFYPDEIRDPAHLDINLDQVNLHENEIKMALSLIDNLGTNFDARRYHNEYRQALWEVIQNKIAGRQVVEKPAAPEAAPVVDLMEALKASVKLAQETRQPETERVH